MQNGIINIKMINIVTPEMICFDRTLNAANHFFRILSNVVITLNSHAYRDRSSGPTFKKMKPR